MLLFFLVCTNYLIVDLKSSFCVEKEDEEKDFTVKKPH